MSARLKCDSEEGAKAEKNGSRRNDGENKYMIRSH